MGEVLEASVKLLDDKMMYEGSSGDNPKIITDYPPPVGNGKGYTSLQIFLISLSSCLGGSVGPLLRRMGKDVGGLTIAAKGERREQHPTCFEKIELNISLTSKDATEEDVDKVIKLSEEKICPVLAMIKGNVEVSIKYEIVK